MPIDPTFSPGFFAANPALATMVDKAAGNINTNPLNKKAGGGTTATATATAGGNTATATATAGQPGEGENKVLFYARQVLEGALHQGQSALGRAPGGAIGSFTTGLVQGLATGLSNSYAPAAPSPTDCFPPSTGTPSMLSVDSKSGAITTAGGYKIEACGQFEWKITGPDGKSTRVWGDPHVETSKGGKFDFKKDTQFVLPDGAVINVKCVPWSGNQNVTVTQALEIVQGSDRIQIDDIDKGKGKTGALAHGGQGAKETFKTDQQFIAGTSVDTWYFHGSEILSNANGTPDLFNVGKSVLTDVMGASMNGWQNSPITEAAWRVGEYGLRDGNQLAAILQKHGQMVQKGGMNEALQQVLAMLPKLLAALQSLIKLGSFNPYTTQPLPKPTEPPKPQPVQYDPNAHKAGLEAAFKALGSMLVIVGQLMQLMATMKPANPAVQAR